MQVEMLQVARTYFKRAFSPGATILGNEKYKRIKRTKEIESNKTP